MGVLRAESGLGRNAGNASICARRSGEALTRNQFAPSSLRATLDCVRAGILPWRARQQFGQEQFH